VLITNRKSHMGLLPMNDLERRSAIILRYSTEFGSFGSNYGCLGLPISRCLRQKCSPKTLVLGNVGSMAIFADSMEIRPTENEYNN